MQAAGWQQWLQQTVADGLRRRCGIAGLTVYPVSAPAVLAAHDTIQSPGGSRYLAMRLFLLKQAAFVRAEEQPAWRLRLAGCAEQQA